MRGGVPSHRRIYRGTVAVYKRGGTLLSPAGLGMLPTAVHEANKACILRSLSWPSQLGTCSDIASASVWTGRIRFSPPIEEVDGYTVLS